MSRSLITGVLLAVLTLSLSSVAHATPVILLTFNYLQNLEPVADFYNGGSSKAPNLGITFSSNFYGLRSTAKGGTGNFSPDPTGSPAIFINGLSGSTVTGTMNVSGGFSSGINFYYTAAFQQTVTVWSGANGTGTALATITLAPNDAGCHNSYCTWSDVALTFSGSAQSVTFTGMANGIGIADITIGQSTTAIPEPSSIYLFGTGLMGMSGYWVRRLFRV